jgi:ferritin
MLSKNLEKALNEQIAMETFACNYYLAMASWCDKSGLQGAAKFLYAHSQQEQAHMLKLFHYINDAGGFARVAATEAPPSDFKTLANLFELVLNQERKVTEAINRLVDICLTEKDYSSFNFLQWYVAEQHEEELVMTRILDLIKITGLEGRGLYHVDKEISQMIKS